MPEHLGSLRTTANDLVACVRALADPPHASGDHDVDTRRAAILGVLGAAARDDPFDGPRMRTYAEAGAFLIAERTDGSLRVQRLGIGTDPRRQVDYVRHGVVAAVPQPLLFSSYEARSRVRALPEDAQLLHDTALRRAEEALADRERTAGLGSVSPRYGLPRSVVRLPMEIKDARWSLDLVPVGPSWMVVGAPGGRLCPKVGELGWLARAARRFADLLPELPPADELLMRALLLTALVYPNSRPGLVSRPFVVSHRGAATLLVACDTAGLTPAGIAAALGRSDVEVGVLMAQSREFFVSNSHLRTRVRDVARALCALYEPTDTALTWTRYSP